MNTSPEQPKRKRPTGRRVGDSGTRDAVLDAARDLFAEQGYDKASMRAIASQAGVDPALIRHFFGDKEHLFAETMAARTAIPERMGAAIAGPPEGLGRRATDAYLRLWEDPDTRSILLGLVRSAMTSEYGVQLLVETMAGRMPVDTPMPDVRNPKARSLGLAASHLFGVAVARHVLRLPVIADMPHDDLVDSLAPVIQRYLAGAATE